VAAAAEENFKAVPGAGDAGNVDGVDADARGDEGTVNEALVAMMSL